MSSIIDWIRTKLFNGTQVNVSTSDMNEFWSLASSLYVRELAFQSCVNLVAKALSKCEIKTYKAGKEVKGDIWYSWNIRPNRNQSSSVFMNKLVAKLMENNEALVVQSDTGDMLVADSYSKQVFAIRDYIFTGVTVDDFVYQRPFFMSDVMFFQLNNRDVRTIISGLHESYGKLLEYSEKAFQKSRGQKGTLKIDASESGKIDFAKTLSNMMNERFKPYFEADSAVLPLTKGYEYTEQDRKTYNADSTRDMRAQVDDVFVFTGRAFGIPPALLLGDLSDTSKATDTLLTFCIDPLTDMISEEANGKQYGKRVLQGDKMVIDTRAIKHIDLLSVSTAIDKLIGSGAFTVNDIRKITGDEPINEPWANQHFMTKNYSPADDLMNALGERSND